MADVPGIAEVDLTGFVRDRAHGQPVWVGLEGVRFRSSYRPEQPPLPCGFAEGDRLLQVWTRGALAPGVGLVEAGVEHPGELPALYRLTKGPLPAGPADRLGRRYAAGYLVPRARSWLHLELWADEETDDVGRGEFAARHLPDGLYQPGRAWSWFAGDDGIPLACDPADAADLDDVFPLHALSRLRTAMRQVVPSLRFEDWFVASPPFVPEVTEV